jgi:hypothetical protein
MADPPTDDIYLFLFPARVDGSDGHLAVHVPLESETHYWSFDLEGIEHLPQDVVDKLTLPHVNFRAFVRGGSWSEEAYDTIAKVQHRKGFEPTSQDVAIKLGYPLVDVDRLNNLINDGKVSRLHPATEHKYI